jgi:hypothetical protein
MYTACERCKHFNEAPPPLRLFSTSPDRSAGGIKAERQVLDAESRLRGEERRRVEDPNYAFNYRPDFSAWCGRFTCNEKQIEALTNALLKGGQQAVVEEARKDSLAFAVNPVRGRVERIYVICSRRNKGQCEGFQAAEPAST